MLSVRSATDFPKVFQLALFVCVPRLCTQCNYAGTVVTEAGVSVTLSRRAGRSLSAAITLASTRFHISTQIAASPSAVTGGYCWPPL